MTEFLENVKKDLSSALTELQEAAKVEKGGILVVGCSTSEVNGDRIGSAGSPDTAKAIFEACRDFCEKEGLYLAVQCCEHLNRSIVIEKAAMKEYGLTRVNAVPQIHAGGSLGTVTYEGMKEPVLVSSVVADMGIDIGDTLIGMHIRPVVVPVRTSVKKIGFANLVLARSRCPYVGGERAVYDKTLG